MQTLPDRRKLEQRRDALLAELRTLGNLMRGSISEVGVRCGRSGCACAQGVKHRKVHLSVNLHGRTRSCYLGREREAVVAPLIAEYERAWCLINELTAVNLALLRGTHPGGAARGRARPR
jgi:transposase